MFLLLAKQLIGILSIAAFLARTHSLESLSCVKSLKTESCLKVGLVSLVDLASENGFY